MQLSLGFFSATSSYLGVRYAAVSRSLLCHEFVPRGGFLLRGLFIVVLRIRDSNDGNRLIRICVICVS